MSRYTDCPFLNEYVIDDFLVSDDDPILYETQGTATESLVNLNHYDTMSRASTFSLSLESDSSPPRRRYSRRQRARQQIPSSQEVERQQRAEAERHALQGRNRRRIVVESDNEEVTAYIYGGGYFNVGLTAEEINILSTYMIVEWFGYQLASIENTRMKFSGSDFKFTSQANHMQKLLAIKKDYEREGFHLQRLYKRRKIDNKGKVISTLAKIVAPQGQEE